MFFVPKSGSTEQFVSAAVWLAITAIVGTAVVLTAWEYGLHVGVHPRQTAIAAAELSAAASVAMLCRNAAPRCSAAVGSSLILVLGAMAAGILGSVGQMFPLPFVDDSLAAADELLRLQTADVVRVVIQFRGGPPILAMLYELATPMLFVSTLALSCLGRFERVWELCAAFTFCIFLATLTSVLFPAAGAFEHSGIAAQYGAHLPGGSGVYHLRMLYSLRSASELTIDPFALRGMVTFPSFHCDGVDDGGSLARRP